MNIRTTTFMLAVAFVATGIAAGSDTVSEAIQDNLLIPTAAAEEDEESDEEEEEGTAGELYANASADMTGEEGKSIGDLTFEQSETEVEVYGLMSNSAAKELFGNHDNGPFALFVHEGDECGEPGDFEGIGEPLDVEGSEGLYTGALGNLETKEGESWVKAEFTTDEVTVGGGDTDVSGLLAVIYESDNDGEAEPMGGAGDPIACGVLEPSE